jgi:hypothetical protein
MPGKVYWTFIEGSAKYATIETQGTAFDSPGSARH